jgi:LuxR family transcriptional regulator, maltose regulon positive regulatory protein
LPERWMGVTVMQEGQVQMAAGAYAEAVPFFERAGNAASGRQAKFCHCLAHLAHALRHFDAGDAPAGRTALGAGLALARELAWLNFFRACSPVAAAVCALALEHGIEAPFAREVIAARSLQSVRPDLSAWPWPIRVRALGGLRIEIDGAHLAFKGKVARKPLELLLFIVASGGADVSTATAAFALWRELDGDKARAALNIALHRLRKLLGNDDAVLLEAGRLGLDPKLVWVDCLAFEQLVDSVGNASAEALEERTRGLAQRALALYTGAFVHDSEDEAWQMIYRSRLASKFMRTVRLLSRAAIARGDRGAARALLERGLELDPLAEDLARELMRALIDGGEQAAALAVWKRCRDALAGAFGTAPSPATLALVAPLLGSTST